MTGLMYFAALEWKSIVVLWILAGFKVNFLRGAPPQSSTSLLWTTIVVHDIVFKKVNKQLQVN